MGRFLILVGVLVLGVASSAEADISYPSAAVGPVKGKLQLAFRITVSDDDATKIRAWPQGRTIATEEPDAPIIEYRGKNVSCEDISFNEGSGPEFECETVFDANGHAAVPKKLLFASEVQQFQFADGTASVSSTGELLVTITGNAGTLLYFWVPQNPVLICDVENGTAQQVNGSCTLRLDLDLRKVLPNAN